MIGGTDSASGEVTLASKWQAGNSCNLSARIEVP
jgi:hypothetical protein